MMKKSQRKRKKRTKKKRMKNQSDFQSEPKTALLMANPT